MASLGSSVPVDCPVCDTPVRLPVRDLGRAGSVLSVTIDTGPLHAHVADAHPPSTAGAER